MLVYFVSAAGCHCFDFAVMPRRMKKRVIFGTMAYQKLLNYQISFSLFKVSLPWKFQMSLFCVSGTHGAKQTTFSFMPNGKKVSYLT